MSNELPLITVLMPCYNAMPFLTEALESIIKQTYTNLEILCINDGSTDETGNVLEKYAALDERIRVVHNTKNIKLIRTLNKGIELARGEYIARMDADDIAAPQRLELQLNYLRQHPVVDVISCGLWVITEEGKVVSKVIPRQKTYIGCLFASFFYVPIGHPELLIKAEIFKKNHFLEEEYAIHTEDYELWSRLLLKGYHLQNMDTLLHYFRINSKSVSRMYTKIQDENFVTCAQKHYFNYTGKNYPMDIVKIMVNRIDSSIKLNELRYAAREMRRFKNNFLKKNKDTINREMEREVHVVYYTQLLDIIIQIIKRNSLACKLYSFWILCRNTFMLLYPEVWSYMKNKLNR